MHDRERDWVADVLRQWNCYEQDWVQGAPVLVRFERTDALIDEASVILKEESGQNGGVGSALEDAAQCWRVDPGLGSLVGRCLTPRMVQRLLFNGSPFIHPASNADKPGILP